MLLYHSLRERKALNQAVTDVRDGFILFALVQLSLQLLLFRMIKEKLSETKTHLSGQSFLCDHFECVDDRNVAEPPGNGQSAVPILEQNGER